MKTKQYLKTLIALRIKWTGMVKIKHKDFNGAVPVMPRGLEDLWRRENPDFYEFTRYDRSFSKDPE